MNWNDFWMGAAAGAITASSIAGVVWLASDNRGAPAGGATTERAAVRDDVGALRAQLAAATDRIAELEQGAGRTAVATGSAAAAVVDPPTTPTPRGAAAEARFHYSGLDTALAKIDWQVLGGVTAEMQPLLTKLIEAVQNGEGVPLDAAGEIQMLNGELLKQAQIIIDAKLPGEGVNGAFTHPMVVANQLQSVFSQSGQPLTADQQAHMQRLAAQFTGEDDVRRAAYPPDTPKLQVLIEEMALKERFYREARGMLTPEQLALVSNPKTDGITGANLLSEGIAWHAFAQPLSATSRDDLSSMMHQQVMNHVKLDSAHSAQLGAIVQRWTGQYPADFWDADPSPLTALKMLPIDRVRESARLQLGMIQEILDTIPVTPAQRRALLGQQPVFVPIRKS